MRNLLCVAAVAALCLGTTAYGETFDLRVVTDTGADAVTVNPGDPVNIVIQGMLTTSGPNTTLGLALFGVNLSGVGDDTVDLCADISLVADAGMSSFVKNDGLTNPDGYGGTCNPAPVAPMDSQLWQIGGGQNTINNNSGNAPYPTGAVVTGIGNGGAWVDLAAGTLATDAGASEATVLALDTAFANTIDAGQSGPVYDVSAITCVLAGDLTINFGGPAPQIDSVVSRRDHGVPEGEVDIAIDPAGTVANMDVSSEPREGGVMELRVTWDGAPGAGDETNITIESQTTAAPGYAAYAGAGLINNVAFDGNTVVLDMSGFEDETTYRLTFNAPFTSAGGQDVEVRMLAGDCDGGLGATPGTSANPTTYGLVDAADKAVMNFWWVNGFQPWTDFRVPLDGVTDAYDKGLLLFNWGNTAP